VDRQSALTTPRRESVRDAGTLSSTEKHRCSANIRLAIWAPSLSCRVCGPDPVFRLRADALGLAIIFGQMGVIHHGHGEFMILGPRHLDDVEFLPRPFWPSLFSGYFFLRAAGFPASARSHAGGVGADPPSLQTAARHAAPTWGLSPDAAGRPIARSRRGEVGVRTAAVDAGSLKVTDSIRCDQRRLRDGLSPC